MQAVGKQEINLEYLNLERPNSNNQSEAQDKKKQVSQFISNIEHWMKKHVFDKLRDWDVWIIDIKLWLDKP